MVFDPSADFPVALPVATTPSPTPEMTPEGLDEEYEVVELPLLELELLQLVTVNKSITNKITLRYEFVFEMWKRSIVPPSVD